MGVTLAGTLMLLHSCTAASQSVSFTWSPNREPDLAGYKIYYGVASRVYTQTLSVGITNRATVSNLVAGSTYYFALVAYDTLGLQSDYTTELSYTVPVLAELQIGVTTNRKTILTLTGPANRTYNIEASSDLRSWATIATVTTGGSGVSVFTENNPPSRSMRFYRARAV